MPLNKWIPASNLEPLRARLAALCADAKRAGQSLDLQIVTGKRELRATIERAITSHQRDCEVIVPWVEVALIGDTDCAPGHNGWSVRAVARLDDTGAVIVGGPDAEVWRPTAPLACDDCGIANGRRILFRVAGPQGDLRCVGSTCARSYLPRGITAEHLLAFAEILWQARQAFDDAEIEGLPKGPRLPRLTYFLAHVARVVRTSGYVSASKAEIEGGKSTALKAWESIDYGAVPEVADVDNGNELARWAEERLAQWLASSTGYERNLGAVVETGLVSARTMGLAASLWGARDREAREAVKRALPQAKRLDAPVGAKIKDLAVTVERVHRYDSHYGPAEIVTLRTADGARLVWFTKETGSAFEAGNELAVSLTVKMHTISRYDGAEETHVLRVKGAKPSKVAA